MGPTASTTICRWRFIVKTSGDERFCCKYDDLVELVNALVPKKKEKKGNNGSGKAEGISLPTDGVT